MYGNIEALKASPKCQEKFPGRFSMVDTLWTCPKSHVDGQNHKNTSFRRAIFHKRPSRRARPSIDGPLGHTVIEKYLECGTAFQTNSPGRRRSLRTPELPNNMRREEKLEKQDYQVQERSHNITASPHSSELDSVGHRWGGFQRHHVYPP